MDYSKTYNIGYQGGVGSFNHAAANILTSQMRNVKLIPCISSQGVCKALKNKEIDFGVMAIYNTTAGVVQESKIALSTLDIEIFDIIDMPIHQCLFCNQLSGKKTIDTVASHIHALNQVTEYLQKHFPHCNIKAVEDTAEAAKKIKENVYEQNVAVVCSEQAGEIYGLKLLGKNIETNKNNRTVFILFK